MPGNNPATYDLGGSFAVPLYAWTDVDQGTWSMLTQSSAWGNAEFTNDASAGDGDALNYKIGIQAGTYTLRIVCRKGASLGIVKVLIDGVVKHTMDCYNATNSFNQATETTGITLTQGLHTIKIKVDGKNASSSGYKGFVVDLSFVLE